MTLPAALASLAAGLVISLAACDTNPVQTPVDWWHGLQGGAIAENRPPPPGADLPYPHLGTIPARPVLPSPAFRTTVQTELAAERDTKERLAARTPIVVTAPPPPPAPAPPPPSPGQADASQTANATIPAAEAPAPSNPAPGPHRPAVPQDGPAPSTPVSFIGDVPTETLPDIPDAPPSPPPFMQIAAQPAPTPTLPPPPASRADGAVVLFATGSATLAPTQGETLGHIVATRLHGTIAVEGHGDAASDTPGAQQAALDLGLTRAHAIAAALVKRFVPEDKILLSATAYGRDATLRIIPAPVQNTDR